MIERKNLLDVGEHLRTSSGAQGRIALANLHPSDFTLKFAQANLVVSHPCDTSMESSLIWPMSTLFEPQVELLLESSSAQAKSCISEAPGQVIIASPYLTSPTCEDVIGQANPGTTMVLTNFRAENFARGSSSLDTVRKLVTSGFNVRHLEALHAKFVLTKQHCLVGSQNLTFGGTQNREATAVIVDPEVCKRVKTELRSWVEQSIPITVEMIDDMAERLPPLLKKFSGLTADAQSLDHLIRDNQQEREREHRAEVERLYKEHRERELLALAGEKHEPLKQAVKKTTISESVRLNLRRVSSTWSPIWTLHVTGSRTLTRWRNLEGSLIRRHRYLVVAPETGLLGWVALNKTRLTYFGKTLTPNSTVRAYGRTWNVERIELNWNLETLQEWNVGFTLTLQSTLETVRPLLRFSLDNFECTGFKEPAQSYSCDVFLEDLRGPRSRLASELTYELLKPFKYTHNRHGGDSEDARAFCRGLGSWPVLHLRERRHPFFSLEK